MDIAALEYNETNSQFLENRTTSEAINILEKIELYYTPFLVALGSLGNWLSVIVFFSTKLRKLSSSVYLAALAISDTGFLLTIFVTWLAMIDVPLFNQHVICELSVYLSSVCSFLSVWFVVGFTVERFIAVGYPLKRPSMCTVSRAKIVLTGLTITSLLFYMPTIFISGLQEVVKSTNKTIKVCDLKEEHKELGSILNSIDFFVVLIIPFFAISIINTSICLTVWRLARIRRTMTLSVAGRSANGLNLRTAIRTPSSIRSQSSQTKVTKMLLVVSTVFICLNLPSYVLRTATHFRDVSSNTIILFFCIAVWGN